MGIRAAVEVDVCHWEPLGQSFWEGAKKRLTELRGLRIGNHLGPEPYCNPLPGAAIA